MRKIRTWLPISFIVIFCLFIGISIRDTQEKNYDTDFDQDQIETHIENLTANGPRSIADREENQNALNYIMETLESYGVVNEDTADAPAYLVQDFVAEDPDYQNWYLKNIIVHIPANSDTPTNEAVMFMGHTDSVPMGDGASDDGIACAVMLEAINYYLTQMENGYTFSNDLVFCFVNGEEYGLYGSEAFMEEFDGFDHVVDRIRFGTNLESRGTDGTLIMFETAKNNYNTIQLFSEINENVFTCSIATMIYDMMPNGTDFSNFKEAYQGLNFANISGGEDYHTQNDNLSNAVGTAHLSQQAQVVDAIIDRLADYDLSELYDADESAVFFSYLNLKTVVYNHTAAVILAVLAIILLTANILFRAFYRKERGVKKTAIAAGSIVFGLVLTAAVTYVCYYLFQYIAVLFGTIDIHMVGTITYSNTAIVIGIGLVALAVTAGVSRAACKLFKIEGRDLTRAFAYIHGVLGIVLSFVLADASYLFVFSGLMLLINELLITLVKKTDASQYHGELLASALYLPIVMPVLVLATSALGLTMAYVFGLIFALTVFDAGIYIAPYFKVKKTMLILAAGGVVFLAVSMAEPNAHVNLQGKQNIAKLAYDDALVYAVDEGKEGAAEYRVYDLNAYSALKKYAPEMEYTGDSCYAGEGEAIDVEVSILSSAEQDTMTIRKADEKALVYLTFKNISAESFTIADGTTTREYSFAENTDEEGTYGITVHSDCTVTLTGGSADVEYREVIRDYAPCIPDEYEEAEKLHFNLWLLNEYSLSE